MSNNEKKGSIHWIALIVLIFGAGFIYMLPLLRIGYYDTLLSVLNVNNSQLGLLASIYGIAGLVGALPGGIIADRFSLKTLLIISFGGTGLAGFWFATFPSFASLVVIYSIWGITTVTLFYPAYIKAIRQCGSPEAQGRVFGLQEGGRKFLGAFVSLGGLAIFSAAVSDVEGLKWVIIFYSVCHIIAAGATWIFYKEDKKAKLTEKENTKKFDWTEVVALLKMKSIWLITLIVFTLYVILQFSYYITPYTTKVIGVSVFVGALLGYLRTYACAPIGAVTAGFLADKFGKTKVMVVSLILIIASLLVFVIAPGTAKSLPILIVAMMMILILLYSVRGIYWTLISEGGIPTHQTGLAVGIVSTIGFSPESFAPFIIGKILDIYGGVTGYKIMFGACVILAAITILGVIIFNKSVIQKRINSSNA